MRNKKSILTIVAMLLITMSLVACGNTNQFMSSEDKSTVVDGVSEDDKDSSKIKTPDNSKELDSDEIDNSDSTDNSDSESSDIKDSKPIDKKDDARSEEEIIKGVLRIRQWKAPNVKCMLPVKRTSFR